MRKVRDMEERKVQSSGGLNPFNVFWSWYEPKNFGDWVNPYLFERITGAEAIHCSGRHLLPGATAVYGCGSVLRHILRPDVAIVWGSGIIDRQDRFERPLRTLAVRGPFSRARMLELGYDCPEVYGDPALLLPDVYSPRRGDMAPVGVIPHYTELAALRAQPLPKGWRLIDVTRPLEAVVDDIAGCERTVSSSLHGLIVSHAYGVPSAWIAAESQLHGDGVKFLDYLTSVGIDENVKPGSWSAVRAGDLSALTFYQPDVRGRQGQLRESCPFQGALAAMGAP